MTTSERSPSWATVGLVHAPVELLVAFACHHLDLGAREIRMYFDWPNAKDIDFLNRIPGCIVTGCDTDFWQGNFGVPRPDSFVRRQRLIATHGYLRTAANWIAHIDCDEFLAPKTSVAEALANVSENVIGVRVQNVERAWVATSDTPTIFGGSFRVPLEGAHPNPTRLFGAMSAYSEYGFSAYRVGKSFTRAKQNVHLGVHGPRPIDYRIREEIPAFATDDMVLSHFDGLTPLHWVSKMSYYDGTQQYVGSKRDLHRAAQVAYVSKAGGDLATIRHLHQMLKLVGRRKARQLAAKGYLIDLALDPVAAVNRILPQYDADFSPAAFDRLLALHNPQTAKIIDAWNQLEAQPPAAED